MKRRDRRKRKPIRFYDKFYSKRKWEIIKELMFRKKLKRLKKENEEKFNNEDKNKISQMTNHNKHLWVKRGRKGNEIDRFFCLGDWLREEGII